MEPEPGQADPALLVVVRQSLVLSLGLLLLFAAFLSRQSSSIHLWLEGSWWLVATSMATVLIISGIFEAIVDEGNSSNNVAILEIVELCELFIFLGLAVAANLARKRSGVVYARARAAFWVGTIVVVILWSISSLLSIVTSGRATPGNIITMTATVIIAVLMIADKLVVTWNNIDPSTMTEQEAHRDLHEHLVPESKDDQEGLHRDVLKEQERLSLTESGGAIHEVDPNREGRSGPKYGIPSTYRSGGLQPDEETGFPM